MCRNILLIALILLPVSASAQEPNPQAQFAEADVTTASGDSAFRYTTYFYTAATAVVHGYDDDTNARIVSMDQNRTIWSGKLGPGETKVVPTGGGVFRFLSDKKAALLIGTPYSYTPSPRAVVGHWLRDQEGTVVADHFYGRIRASRSADDRVIVWAWDDVDVRITDVTTSKLIKREKVKKGGYLEITKPEISALGTHVLEFSADKKRMAVLLARGINRNGNEGVETGSEAGESVVLFLVNGWDGEWKVIDY